MTRHMPALPQSPGRATPNSRPASRPDSSTETSATSRATGRSEQKKRGHRRFVRREQQPSSRRERKGVRRRSDAVTESEWRQIKALLLKRFGSLRAAFANFNTDSRREARGDKHLDIEEIKRGLTIVGLPQMLAGRLLGSLDIDGNGQVSFDEFCRAVEDPPCMFQNAIDVEVQTEAAYDKEAVLRKRVVRLTRGARSAHDLTRQDETATRQALKARHVARRHIGDVMRLRRRTVIEGQRAARRRVAAAEAQVRDILLLEFTHSCAEHWYARDTELLRRRIESLRVDVESMEAHLAAC
eukprot:TRINITY_DN29721_c0_g1_i1.p1 TRINITY_DN29721_c0_g1~~TRINITY_DN29721_c0_g1_i1.p1  ORF type:complete len:298 (+),score=71.89 TRINITY_DN29721_c0_g1_i1:54-947(+)